ncbi:cysteine methyltransferase [Platysternon megacephalum]|uniref:Cysteine methyltransferase n=1 Tax=Platysternon megacephalum TaxID=55544 RepID=A0A4D9DJ72_9SAUR|nr:cysteine methyltransferase [Platysternon megacephalum]
MEKDKDLDLESLSELEDGLEEARDTASVVRSYVEGLVSSAAWGLLRDPVCFNHY